jgi:hypothetical protein
MAGRRTLDETRALLLDVGVQLLVETGVEVNANRISLIDVCREAGLKTSGSAYKIWPNQEQFRIDLMRRLLGAVTVRPDTIDLIAESISADSPLPAPSEFLRTIANENATTDMERRDFDLYIGVWLAAINDPELARALTDSDIDIAASYSRLYDSVMDAYDLEWVPPFDATLFAITVGALAEGFSICSRHAPERVPTALMRPTGPNGEDQPWHLYACGVQAIVDAFTRPKS